MKPRGKDESDAGYIGRLEQANASLRADNKLLSEANDKFVRHGRVAASQAGAILNMAAEACGMTDDRDVRAAREALDALAGLPWSEIPKTFPPLDLPKLAGTDWRGDAEMVVCSAYEQAMSQACDPLVFMNVLGRAKPAERDAMLDLILKLAELARANVSDQVKAATGVDFAQPVAPAPEVKTLEEARELINCTWFEITDALSDVAYCQVLLRLDLRAAMYDTALRRIHDILRNANVAAETLPRSAQVLEDDELPF